MECKGITLCSAVALLTSIIQVPMGLLPIGGAAALSPRKYSADP